MQVPTFPFVRLAVACILLAVQFVARASITLTDTNQTLAAFDLTLFGYGTPPPDTPHPARLIQVSLDSDCQFTMAGQPQYDLSVNATDGGDDKLVAIVTLNPLCPRAFSVLQASRETSSPSARAILAAIDTLLFPSRFNSTSDIGGFNEDTYNYYLDYLPYDEAHLMAIGADVLQTMLQALGTTNSTAGLAITLVHDVSPWTDYYYSTTHAVIRWLFFTLGLIATLYVTFHLYCLVFRERYMCHGRYLFRLASSVCLFIHLFFFLIYPLEDVLTKGRFCVFILASMSEYFAYAFLIMQWMRVVESIYRWRFIKYLNAFFIFTGLVMLLLLIMFFVKTYVTLTPAGVIFLMVLQQFAMPILTVLELISLLVCCGIVTRSQWNLRKTGSGPMALVKLTYLCTLSCLGWVICLGCIIATLVFPPGVKSFSLFTVLVQIATLLSAAAIFWTLAVASQVRSTLGSSAGRSSEQKSGRSEGPELAYAMNHFSRGSAAQLRDPSGLPPGEISDSCDEDEGNPGFNEKRSHLRRLSPKPANPAHYHHHTDDHHQQPVSAPLAFEYDNHEPKHIV
ncbi:hypothetical protein IWQ60_012162 [Tieghemiomyces parasiticus]|uniref:Uncharacterized protein n=1 Tax=Tieghemiomyces parasiticus TaxID=78921 RepID=A0A9W8DLM1_9FUNG|nr:hypothetical protein IWQ60_012162 [Tieghemiomyces parasiticus]